jgi:hypothetical protein
LDFANRSTQSQPRSNKCLNTNSNAVALGTLTQPERIAEVNRIAATKSVQVERTRQPDGVFLGELSGPAVPLKQRAAKWK